jgi:pimeloyl-ACP methyl ester carboxylesterase
MRWKRRTVNSNGVRLAVRDSGGEGKPGVLEHGLGFGQHSWDRVAPRLSTGGLRVVTYDQRGHGASDTSDDYSPSAFCEDLAAVLDDLGLKEPILVGHSLGATVVLEYVASHGGCAGVVCVDGGLPVAVPSADWETMRAEMRRPIPRLAAWA